MGLTLAPLCGHCHQVGLSLGDPPIDTYVRRSLVTLLIHLKRSATLKVCIYIYCMHIYMKYPKPHPVQPQDLEVRI